MTTGSDEEFRALAGGKEEFAAATTVDRIVFAPGATAISITSLDRAALRAEARRFFGFTDDARV
ncbi:hypothetical protein FZI93_28030, partial [Mycobacterium sp. CBMA361]|nr:hypothetical protein [Mycolicibacterium sp. CBMA 361]